MRSASHRMADPAKGRKRTDRTRWRQKKRSGETGLTGPSIAIFVFHGRAVAGGKRPLRPLGR